LLAEKIPHMWEAKIFWHAKIYKRTAVVSNE
jgi:hypothetical protein